MSISPNKAAAPNRRPRFPLVTLAAFGNPFCAQGAVPAAVGEPRRWDNAHNDSH